MWFSRFQKILSLPDRVCRFLFHFTLLLLPFLLLPFLLLHHLHPSIGLSSIQFSLDRYFMGSEDEERRGVNLMKGFNDSLLLLSLSLISFFLTYSFSSHSQMFFLFIRSLRIVCQVFLFTHKRGEDWPDGDEYGESTSLFFSLSVKIPKEENGMREREKEDDKDFQGLTHRILFSFLS